MSLFGIEIQPNHVFHQPSLPYTLRLTLATLPHELKSNKDRTTLMLKAQGMTSALSLCSLTPGHQEQLNLDLILDAGQEVEFFVKGPNTITLLGNFLPDDDMEDEEDMSDYDEEEEDESVFSDDVVYMDEVIGNSISDSEGYEESDLENDDGIHIEEVHEEEESVPLLIPDASNSASTQPSQSLKKQDPEHEKIVPMELDETPMDQQTPLASSKRKVKESEATPRATMTKPKKMPTLNKDMDATPKPLTKATPKVTSTTTTNVNKENGSSSSTSNEPASTNSKSKAKRKSKSKAKLEVSTSSNEPISAPFTNSTHPPSSSSSSTSTSTSTSYTASSKGVTKRLSTATDLDDDEEQEASAIKKDTSKASISSTSTTISSSSSSSTPTQSKKKKPKLEPQRISLPSGLQYEDLTVANAQAPKAHVGQLVGVRYIGRLQKTGKVFDMNVQGAPFKFRLGKKEVILGWDQGIVGLAQGQRRKLIIPPHLAYGKRGAPPDIPPNAVLEFEVKLVNIFK